MIRTIARHELADVVRDGRFRSAAGFTLLLLAVALLTGWTYQRDVAAEHESAARFSRETWLAQPARDPHSAAHYGAYAFKPRGPLTLFDSGVNQFAGVATWLEAHKQNEFQFRPAQDRSSVARLGQLTGAATLQFLVPILIILLAYTKFAGERENGTLRQALAAGIEPWRLAAGKMAGVLAALAIVLVPAAVIGATAMTAAAEPNIVGGVVERVLLLAVAYGAYFLVFALVALAVSAGVSRSSHALALLVAFWVVNAVLVPRIAVDVSRTLHPTPTAFAFAQAVHRDTYDGLPVHAYSVRRAADLRQRLTSEYGVARVQDLPVNFRGVDYLEREAHSNDVWDRHYTALWTAFAGQVRMHLLAGWVAPLMALRNVSMALSGVDYFHHRDFAAAAEAYRRQLVLAMNSQLAYGGNSARMGSYQADASFWSSIGAFDYRQPSMRWAIGNVSSSAGALGAWVLAGAALLAMSVRRMGVQ